MWGEVPWCEPITDRARSMRLRRNSVFHLPLSGHGSLNGGLATFGSGERSESRTMRSSECWTPAMCHPRGKPDMPQVVGNGDTDRPGEGGRLVERPTRDLRPHPTYRMLSAPTVAGRIRRI